MLLNEYQFPDVRSKICQSAVGPVAAICRRLNERQLPTDNFKAANVSNVGVTRIKN